MILEREEGEGRFAVLVIILEVETGLDLECCLCLDYAVL